VSIFMDAQAISFGEVLFDVFEDGAHLGGAPLNFAWYLRQFGVPVAMVSAIGRDEYGVRVQATLARAGINQTWLAVRDEPTGSVDVKLVDGQPAYTINTGVAWDVIELTGELPARPALLYFGTLAQRTDVNRATLRRLLALDPPQRFFDVNFRMHFYSDELVLEGLRNSTIVKLNEDEWTVLKGITKLGEPLDVVRQFGLQALIVTQGERGASLFTAGREYTANCPPVTLVDAVGAGDAFSAVMAAAAIRGVPLERALPLANEVGAFVVGRRGAQAELPVELRRAL
jgi:fructokinase